MMLAGCLSVVALALVVAVAPLLALLMWCLQPTPSLSQIIHAARR